MENQELDNLDISRLHKIISDHGEDLLIELIKIYGNYGPQVDSMGAHIQTNQIDKCKFITHKLSAASAQLGALSLSERCREFENSKEDTARDAFTKMFLEIKALYDKSHQDLQQFVMTLRVPQGSVLASGAGGVITAGTDARTAIK